MKGPLCAGAEQARRVPAREGGLRGPWAGSNATLAASILH